MISRGFVIWLALVVVIVLASVRIGITVEALHDDLQALQAEQAIEHDRIRVLRASYAHLTAVDQLAPLVERHLDLEPIGGDQVVLFTDLPLPPVEPDGPADILGTLEPGQPVSPAETPDVPRDVPGTAPSADAKPDLPSVNGRAPAPARPDAPAPRPGERRFDASPDNPPWLKAQKPPRLQSVTISKPER